MKATLKFNLDEYDDRVAHTLCTKAPKLSLIIWELDQWLRENYKYDKGDIGVEEAEIVRSKLREIMEENDLTFDNEIFT